MAGLLNEGTRYVPNKNNFYWRFNLLLKMVNINKSISRKANKSGVLNYLLCKRQRRCGEFLHIRCPVRISGFYCSYYFGRRAGDRDADMAGGIAVTVAGWACSTGFCESPIGA